MARDLLNRYIWIVDTIRRYGRISRRELDRLWSLCPYANGETRIPRRTFYNYRQAIEELFSVSIACDPGTYEYYIEDAEGPAGEQIRPPAMCCKARATSPPGLCSRRCHRRVSICRR